jgi:hypothetical protein
MCEMFSTARLYADSVMIDRNVATFHEKHPRQANLQLKNSQLILRKRSSVFLIRQNSLIRTGDACNMEAKVPLFRRPP